MQGPLSQPTSRLRYGLGQCRKRRQARGKLVSVDIDQCVADILDIGHCVVPNHFPKPAIDAFHEGFLPLLEEVAARIPEGNRRANRWAIGLPFAPPFYQSAFFGDDTVNEIVRRILGESMFIAYYGTDTPVAGSEDQQVHSDIRPLFRSSPTCAIRRRRSRCGSRAWT